MLIGVNSIKIGGEGSGTPPSEGSRAMGQLAGEKEADRIFFEDERNNSVFTLIEITKKKVVTICSLLHLACVLWHGL